MYDGLKFKGFMFWEVSIVFKDNKWNASCFYDFI